VAKFTVLTFNDRNLVIEAERYVEDSSSYHFFSGGIIVASVHNSPNIFAVVNQEAEKADFYFADHREDDTFTPPQEYDEEETDDVCLDCRIADFLDSQEGFNAIADVVYAIRENDGDDQEEKDTLSVSVEIPYPGVWSVDADGNAEEVTA
jgi:hypothetical protein